jgi:hypothetical protein
MSLCRDMIMSCHEKILCCLKCEVAQSVVQSDPTKCSIHAAQIAGCRVGSPRWLANAFVARTFLVESRSRRACTPPMVCPSTSTFQRGLITQIRASRREHQTFTNPKTIFRSIAALSRTQKHLSAAVCCIVQRCTGPDVTQCGVSQHVVARGINLPIPSFGFQVFKHADLACSRMTSTRTM